MLPLNNILSKLIRQMRCLTVKTKKMYVLRKKKHWRFSLNDFIRRFFMQNVSFGGILESNAFFVFFIKTSTKIVPKFFRLKISSHETKSFVIKICFLQFSLTLTLLRLTFRLVRQKMKWEAPIYLSMNLNKKKNFFEMQMKWVRMWSKVCSTLKIYLIKKDWDSLKNKTKIKVEI